MENQEYIYIVLVKAMTRIGKLARKITKYEYTHIALCLNEKLDDFLSFSRKQHYAPFNSGFMHETINCYAFGKNEKIKLKIFKIPVTKEKKKQIKDYIKKIENDQEYIFNIYSMITMPLLNGFTIYKTHNCMSFTSKIIELTDTVKMEKKYYKYNIKEIDKLLSDYKYKEQYFYKTKKQNENYMKKISIVKNIKMFTKLNVKLIKRMIKYKKQND